MKLRGVRFVFYFAFVILLLGVVSADSCRGTPYFCTNYAFGVQSGCESQLGCFWGHTYIYGEETYECDGTATACYNFGTEAFCLGQLGCTWDNDYYSAFWKHGKSNPAYHLGLDSCDNSVSSEFHCPNNVEKDCIDVFSIGYMRHVHCYKEEVQDLPADIDGLGLGAVNLSSGLVAYFDFEEGSVNLKSGLVAYLDFEDNVLDKSGNSRDLMLPGGARNPSFIDGKQGKAVNFDGLSGGNGDYLKSDTEADFDLLGNISVSMWIKPTRTTLQYLFSKTNEATSGAQKHNYQISLSGNKIYTHLGNGVNYRNYVSTTSVALNEWNHIVVVYNMVSGATTICINNTCSTRQGTTTLGSLVNTAYPLRIGLTRFNDADAYLFKGGIDEVVVYDRILYRDEVSALYTLSDVLGNVTDEGGDGNVTCTDSDGGLDYYVKGNVILAGENVPNLYETANLNSVTDGVQISSSASALLKLNGVQRGVTSGVSYLFGNQRYLVKSINYNQIDESASYVSLMLVYAEDLCVDNTLVEGSCSNSLFVQTDYPCPYGCSNGACVEEPTVICNNNGTCDSGESCSNCAFDCGVCDFANSCMALTASGNRLGARSRANVDVASGLIEGDNVIGGVKNFTYFGKVYEISFTNASGNDVLYSVKINGNATNFSTTPPVSSLVSSYNQTLSLVDGSAFTTLEISKNNTSGKINVSIQVGETIGVYCDPFTLNYKLMKALDATCLEDFECASNVCVEGTCYSIRTELEAQRGIIQEILCLLRSIFTSQTRVQCLGNLTAGNLAPPTA